MSPSHVLGHPNPCPCSLCASVEREHAAVRAPLEARVAELERQAEDWKGVVQILAERIVDKTQIILSEALQRARDGERVLIPSADGRDVVLQQARRAEQQRPSEASTYSPDKFKAFRAYHAAHEQRPDEARPKKGDPVEVTVMGTVAHDPTSAHVMVWIHGIGDMLFRADQVRPAFQPRSETPRVPTPREVARELRTYAQDAVTFTELQAADLEAWARRIEDMTPLGESASDG